MQEEKITKIEIIVQEQEDFTVAKDLNIPDPQEDNSNFIKNNQINTYGSKDKTQDNRKSCE